MKNLVNNLLYRRYEIRLLSKLENVFKSFSFSGKIVFSFFFTVLILSSIAMLYRVNNSILVSVPARGGSFTEGIIGTPRFINPILAISDADKDLTALVYSGLLRAKPDGTLHTDLAESYTVSDDGLTYKFKLKEDVKFHDKTPVTADDIVFTILRAQDSRLKSPKRANWDGVAVEKINDREIVFTLKQPYAPFLENATLGILPKHLWDTVEPDQFPFSSHNVNPVGTGPYKVKKVKTNSGKIPNLYVLEAFKDYASETPLISKITLRFYSNEEDLIAAFKTHQIENVNSLPANVIEELNLDNSNIENVALSRVFAVFFNQNNSSLLADKVVRRALDAAIDKEMLVNNIFSGYAHPIDSPVPIGFLEPEKKIAEGRDTSTTTVVTHVDRAKNILVNAGWRINEETGIMERKSGKETRQLKFSLSTSNAPELKQTAEILRDEWKKLGAEVEVKVFEVGDLNQNVIRPRRYEALLFGEIIGREFDLYAFWHSSQRNDPGLNIALYTNIDADQYLEDARVSNDPREREDKYRKFEEEIKRDIPAVFLYSPDFIYISPERIKGKEIGKITIPGERFLNIKDWYIEEDRVWKIFL